MLSHDSKATAASFGNTIDSGLPQLSRQANFGTAMVNSMFAGPSTFTPKTPAEKTQTNSPQPIS